MIKEALILAGGLGTRLRSVLPDMPKCMAPVTGHPFLHYIIEYLKKQGIEKFVFSLGYMHEIITEYVNAQYSMLNVEYSIEEEPLGTGGGIKLACKKLTGTDILILNGDTFFAADLNLVSEKHIDNNADCTLCLKPMKNFDRYGVVILNGTNKIESFSEKKFYTEGLINGGMYALNIQSFLQLPFAEKFSFEKDYLEQYYRTKKMYGVIQNEYFIDIGVPEDYKKAQDDVEMLNK